MKVVSDRILIELINDEETSGFVMAQGNPPQKGKIVAAGPGRGSEKMVLEVGDVILFAKGAGQPIKIEGKVLTIMREGDAFLAL